MMSIRQTVRMVLVAGAAAVLLGACGSSGSTGSASGTTGGGASPSAAGGAPGSSSAAGGGAGSSVTATEAEYSITLSMTTFSPGTYTFTVRNQGKFPHNLNVKGPGVAGQVSPMVSPGGTGQLTVTLQKGSYELWCSVDSHKDRGMDMMIQVG